MKNFKSYLFLATFILQLVAVKGQSPPDILAHNTGSKEFINIYAASTFPAMNLLPESQPTIAWTRQLSSTGLEKGNEKIYSMTIDGSGNIILAGVTDGSLFNKSFGGPDAFMAKFDAAGNKIWVNQFGSSGLDSAVSVAVDDAGNIYVAGYTTRSLSDTVSSGEKSLYVRKFDSSGRELWGIQFGSDPLDEAGSISLDSSGNLYVASTRYVRTNGNGPDYKTGFLSKYDSTGKELWARVFEFSDSSQAKTLVVNRSGEIYIGGQNIKLNSYPVGDIDALLQKYSPAANEIWTRKFGESTLNDSINSVTVDSSGNIYVAGYSHSDAFLKKYDSSGAELWKRQFGSYGGAEAFSVSTDISGNIYLAGYINTNARDEVRLDGDDAFVRKYDSSGKELWSFQFGTTYRDIAYAVSVDRSGYVYAAGSTEGAFPGNQYPGNTDAFLVKIVPPEIAAPAPAPTPAPSPSPSPSPVPAPQPSPPPAPEVPPAPEEPPETDSIPSESEPSQE